MNQTWSVMRPTSYIIMSAELIAVNADAMLLLPFRRLCSSRSRLGDQTSFIDPSHTQRCTQPSPAYSHDALPSEHTHPLSNAEKSWSKYFERRLCCNLQQV